MNERPKVAVNVILVKDNELLLGKRKGVAGDGYWGLPGGHLEFGESLEEGAKREMEEETGLEMDLSFESLVNDPRLEEDGTHYLHVNFLALNVSGNLKLMEPDKCYEWKYFDLDKLPSNIFLGHRKIIPAFIEKNSFVD